MCTEDTEREEKGCGVGGVRGLREESARPQKELEPSLQDKENRSKHLRQIGFALIYYLVIKVSLIYF